MVLHHGAPDAQQPAEIWSKSRSKCGQNHGQNNKIGGCNRRSNRRSNPRSETAAQAPKGRRMAGGAGGAAGGRTGRPSRPEKPAFTAEISCAVVKSAVGRGPGPSGQIAVKLLCAESVWRRPVGTGRGVSLSLRCAFGILAPSGLAGAAEAVTRCNPVER